MLMAVYVYVYFVTLPSSKWGGGGANLYDHSGFAIDHI